MDDFEKYISEILEEPFDPLAEYFSSDISMAEISSMEATANDMAEFWASKGLNMDEDDFWIKAILAM